MTRRIEVAYDTVYDQGIPDSGTEVDIDQVQFGGLA
jgi:hypothetical protein